jgi:hypothetical protein
VLGDHHLRATLVQFGDDPIDVEGLVGDQAAEGDALDERRDAHRVVALPGEQLDARINLSAFIGL